MKSIQLQIHSTIASLHCPSIFFAVSLLVLSSSSLISTLRVCVCSYKNILAQLKVLENSMSRLLSFFTLITNYKCFANSRSMLKFNIYIILNVIYLIGF